MQTLGPLAESKGKNPPQSVAESMVSMLAEIEDRRARVKETGGIIGVRTGHRWVDHRTGGLRPGQLVIVAARPSVGKTSLAIQMAAGIARNSGPVLFLSLEMDRTELNERLLGIEAEINISDIRRGTLNAAEHERLIETALRIQDLPLITDERTDGSIELIRSRIEHENAKHKLSAVFVDYLQLIEGAKDTDETRAGVVSEITRGLKLAAKSLKIPVIALSQLNRQAAQGQGSKKAKPELHHLRESGSIEQDADIVIMLDRDPKADQGEIRIAKGRSDGATSWEPIGFTRKFARWEQA
jgi:replicative DNA helicase